MFKVSIIVPVYNVQKYLVKCLDSLINQTLKDIEIICINDGSVDNSLDILQDYAKLDERIIIINKENEGQSVARNIGIESARGEYIGFVDSDDWVDLEYFERLYNSAKANDADIACAGVKRVKTKKVKITKSFIEEKATLDIQEKISLDKVHVQNYVCNKIYKLDTWKNLNIKFQAGRYYEDIALMIKILHQMKLFVVVPNVYYYYRLNPTSTCKQKSSKYSIDYAWAIQELKEYARKNDIRLDMSHIILKKEYFKLLGVTVMKAYYYESKVEYKLFGFIRVADRITM